MEPSKQEKPAPSRWGKVLTGIFVVFMGVRVVALIMKATTGPEPTPAEILARLPRVQVPPPEPIPLGFTPPPPIQIPELKPMSSPSAPGTAKAPAKPEPTSNPEIDGTAELLALQKGGEKARAAAKRLLDHPECGEVSLPYLLLGSELGMAGKSSKAILQVLQEERRTDRVALVEYALQQGGAGTRKPLMDLLAAWGTPEAAAALERLSREHHQPEARALASEALAGLKH